MSQKKQVLAYIQNHGSIDPRRAVLELGIYRLGARVFELRKDGHDIVTVTKTRRAPDGTVKSWGEYHMKDRSELAGPERREGDPDEAPEVTSQYNDNI